MKKPFMSAVVLLTGLVFGRVAAQHDSLSCTTALTRMLRQKAEMQTLNEYDPDNFSKKFPNYHREFTVFLDSLNRYDLWKYVSDPLNLKIEKARLDYYADPTSEKTGAKAELERTLGEIRKSPTESRHALEYAELSNYLSTIYYQRGEVGAEIGICKAAIRVLQENRNEGEVPSLLEWMIRIKLANALQNDSPNEALSFIEKIQTLDVNAYRDYSVNSWRRERFENTVASAWEALGNIYSALGNVRNAIGAYETAMGYTQPKRSTWDSIMLSVVKLQAETGNAGEVDRWAETVRRVKPENLLSLYLVSGNAFYEKKRLDAASEAYRNAFGLLQKASAEEQIKVLSSLVRIYADLGLQDRIFETLNNLMNNKDFLKNDELSYTFSKACVTIGIQIKQDNGLTRDYFKTAEKVLERKTSSGMDFLKNQYAGKYWVLLTRLYIERREKSDLDKAEECLKAILAGYRSAAGKLGFKGDYASDDVVFAKLAGGRISEIKGDSASAVETYKELASDYSVSANRGNLMLHNSKEGVDSSAASLFRISNGYLNRKSFYEALDICDWLSRRSNLPAGLKEKAEFMTGRVDYRWGFADRTKFQQALTVFKRIAPESGWRTEAEIMSALCQYYLGFTEASIDNLITLFSKLRSGAVPDKLIAFLTDENVFGFVRVISESVFMKDGSEKAQSLLESVLDVIDKNKIDTPEEAKGLYALARFTLRNGLPKEQKLKKAESLLAAFFRNKYATSDMWTYFRAGELKMDLDFEMGRLSVAAIQRQIQQLQGFNDSKEELQRIIDSNSFYRGPGIISLEDLDMAGLKEKVQELLAKCFYMLGLVNGKENRWNDALAAYDIVLGRYVRFDLYASKSLYRKGLIYLTALGRIDKAVEIFIQLFRRYDGSQMAVQAMDDLRDAERIARQPREMSAWFKACRKMVDVSEKKTFSKFAVDLAFYLAEKHLGADERYTRDRAVLSAVIQGLGWMAQPRDTTKVCADDAARANLYLARAYRLESDLIPGSVYMRFGVTYPEKNAGDENLCFRRVMRLAKNSFLYGEAQWRLTVNLALAGKPDESKEVAWVQRIANQADTSLSERYEREIGVLVAYAAPVKTRAYNRDVKISIENIIDEAQETGVFPFLVELFNTTRKQVEILKWKTGRPDIRPDVFDLKNYPDGKWSGGAI